MSSSNNKTQKSDKKTKMEKMSQGKTTNLIKTQSDYLKSRHANNNKSINLPANTHQV